MVFDFKTFFCSCQLLVVNRRWDDLELCGPGFNGLLGKIDHRDTLNLMRLYNRNCFTYGGSKVKAKHEAFFTSPPPPVSIPPPVSVPPPALLPSRTPLPLPYSFSYVQIPLFPYLPSLSAPLPALSSLPLMLLSLSPIFSPIPPPLFFLLFRSPPSYFPFIFLTPALNREIRALFEILLLIVFSGEYLLFRQNFQGYGGSNVQSTSAESARFSV